MIFFKFPFNEKIYTAGGDSSESNISFVSFDGKETLNFKGEIKEIKYEDIPDISSDKLEDLELQSGEKEEVYIKKLHEVIDFINENQLPKLVISTRKRADYHKISLSGKISLTGTFLNLCKSYPNAFAYFFIDKNECWMGAFSEVLGKFNKTTSEFETMSLAGTLPVNERWTAKEIAEQKPVTNYIRTVLDHYSESVSQSAISDHISGNIKHLRTDFKAKIEKDELANLISELHPTPAVCGIPKDFCKEAIQRFEGFPRHFYAGFIRIETPGFIQYFVNLRCAKFGKNSAQIFAGGGITAQSIPQKEWRETELKAEAILKNMAISG